MNENETDTNATEEQAQLDEIPEEELEGAAGGRGFSPGAVKGIISFGKGIGKAVEVAGAVGSIGGFIAALNPPKK